MCSRGHQVLNGLIFDGNADDNGDTNDDFSWKVGGEFLQVGVLQEWTLSFLFLSDPGLLVPSMCLEVSEWVSYVVWNFTDVTPADEDTNSILTDKVNRTIQGNVAKQL